MSPVLFECPMINCDFETGMVSSARAHFVEHTSDEIFHYASEQKLLPRTSSWTVAEYRQHVINGIIEYVLQTRAKPGGPQSV